MVGVPNIHLFLQPQRPKLLLQYYRKIKMKKEDQAIERKKRLGRRTGTY
jgi:hypothetical protein